MGFRGITRLFTKDLVSVNSLHKFMGSVGFAFLVSHFVMILASGVYDLDIILSTDLSNPTVLYIKYGSVAFFSVVIIWLTSVLLRKRLPWDWWKSLHYLAYVALTFAFLHSGYIGATLQTNTAAQWFWYFQIVVFVIIIIWRLSDWVGLSRTTYKVNSVEDVARDVKQITIVPEQQVLGIKPKPGQFAYLQYARFKPAHPFTVSHYSEDTGAISFTIKNVGKYTANVHSSLEYNDEVYVGGPYGVFTSTISQSPRPAVLIAGGIGITPFLRHLDNNRVQHLFWGVRTVEDLAYRRDVVRSKLHTTIALSEEERKNYHPGLIDVELLKAELSGELEEYDFYICGPPEMMKSLELELADASVPKGQIFTERFSL